MRLSLAVQADASILLALKVQPAASGGAAAAAGGLPISKDEAARLLAGLLVEALHRSYARVIDLFRSWDKDGSGRVSKAEFRNALPLLQKNGEVHARALPCQHPVALPCHHPWPSLATTPWSALSPRHRHARPTPPHSRPLALFGR